MQITVEVVILIAIIALAGITIVALTIQPLINSRGRAKVHFGTPNGTNGAIEVETERNEPNPLPRSRRPRGRKRRKGKNVRRNA